MPHGEPHSPQEVMEQRNQDSPVQPVAPGPSAPPPPGGYSDALAESLAQTTGSPLDSMLAMIQSAGTGLPDQRNDPPLTFSSSFDPADRKHGPSEVPRSQADLFIFQQAGDRLRDIQQKLFNGGFYNSGVDPEDISWGQPDHHTQTAWSRVIDQAVAFHAAGEGKDPFEILGDAADSRFSQDVPEVPDVRQGRVDQVSLSDPAGLRVLADQIGSEVLGRRLTSEQKAEIVGLLHGAQRAEQMRMISAAQAASAPPDIGRDELGQVTVDGGVVIPDESGMDVPIQRPDTVVETVNVDPRARIEELLRQRFPQEAAGTDAADGYRAFLSMIGAGGLGMGG